jgi:hypothetical protein
MTESSPVPGYFIITNGFAHEKAKLKMGKMAMDDKDREQKR